MPCVTALRAAARLPSGVLGPVDRWAFSWLAFLRASLTGRLGGLRSAAWAGSGPDRVSGGWDVTAIVGGCSGMCGREGASGGRLPRRLGASIVPLLFTIVNHAF